MEEKLKASKHYMVLKVCEREHLQTSKAERECDHGGVAQLGERLPCKQEVIGSNPIISTNGMGS